MINIDDKTQCCGCNACVQRCPKQCINMQEDNEGFLYPKVDMSVCIDCGLCEKVCPFINQNPSRKPLQVFAVKNKNEEQRIRSSSGGVFILLAERIIRQGGVVFGARFDQNWEVEHCYAETLEELTPLMCSKYVQSRIGNSYKEAEQFLKHGCQVLFVGTSCQIAGLLKYLRKDYDNLLAVDFICHGVPSPGVWRRYLQEIITARSEVDGRNKALSSSPKDVPVITGINFREKQRGGYGWKKSGFVVHAQLLSKEHQNSVLLSTISSKDPYMKGFLFNLTLRPSCYACRTKNGASLSDLTIADFWGIQNIHPESDDDKGVGLVFVHTPRGKEVFSQLLSHVECFPSNVSEATHVNSAYLRSVAVPRQRKHFWKLYNKPLIIAEAVEEAMRFTFIDWIYAILQRIINLLKRVLRKGKQCLHIVTVS